MSKVESFQMEIPQLGRTRTVWVYLPTGYKKRGQPYPVIYMHDGQNIFYDHLTAYGTAWHVDQTMEKTLPAKDTVFLKKNGLRIIWILQRMVK